MEAVQKAIESATAVVQSGGIAERLRVTLLEATRKLLVALEKSEDVITKMAYQVCCLLLERCSS